MGKITKSLLVTAPTQKAGVVAFPNVKWKIEK